MLRRAPVSDLAPDIVRQRLLIEGFYAIEVDRAVVAAFLRDLAATLALRAYAEPVIFSPGGEGKAENQGFDAFLPLVDSGIAAYFWTRRRFFSIVIYTCKAFDEAAAVRFAEVSLRVEGETVKLAF
jgi:S-adenosylmethionine decarboxylase